MIRAQAAISTAAIERNCARLAALAPLCAVVKADGYGHDAPPRCGPGESTGRCW